MASYNIEMQYYNGNGYDILKPRVTAEDVFSGVFTGDYNFQNEFSINGKNISDYVNDIYEINSSPFITYASSGNQKTCTISLDKNIIEYNFIFITGDARFSDGSVLFNSNNYNITTTYFNSYQNLIYCCFIFLNNTGMATYSSVFTESGYANSLNGSANCSWDYYNNFYNKVNNTITVYTNSSVSNAAIYTVKLVAF